MSANNIAYPPQFPHQHTSSMRSRQSFPMPAVPNHPSHPDVSQSGPSTSPSRPFANINGTSYAAYQPPSTPSNPPLYRAPAHKHAHHLHTIPPREKSTRTLIIDHLLWVHARTRFAQVRCELAMTDRSSPAPTAADRNALRVPSSRPAALSSAHNRERPETFDEDDEAASDGEDVSVLLARAGGPGHPHDDEEDEREARQDLRLARALRVRAEGIERVITSMLEQPPQDYPFPTDEPVLAPPPSSPRPTSSHGLSMSKHMLPNGVRLRLALATVINELFARQAPVQRHLHAVAAQQSARASSSSTASSATDTPAQDAGGQSPGASPFGPGGALPSGLFPLAMISSGAPVPTGSGPQFSPRPQNQSPQSSRPPPSPVSLPPPNQPQPTPCIRDMFIAGADPSTANSPPGLRCPRHLHTGCEICVEAKENEGRVKGGGKAKSTGALVPGGADAGEEGQGLTGFLEGSGVGSGLARPGPRGSVLRPRVPGGTGADGASSASTDDAKGAGAGAGNTRLSELVPRFMRLSALVALELGREFGGGGGGGGAVDENTPAERGALKPSGAWYALLVGLLTRAVLEGYLSASWRGLAPVQVLLGVGLGWAGGASGAGIAHEGEEMWRRFEPDEMPDLGEAAGVLFPALREMRGREEWAAGGVVRREGAEADYEREMMGRLARFFDVPAGTPDLSTHMEDLAWQWPAEPVERAAVRFCEAIAKWRGKPELETYKKRPPGRPAPTEADTRAPIEHYFVVPPHLTGRKRALELEDGWQPEKRLFVAPPGT